MSFTETNPNYQQLVCEDADMYNSMLSLGEQFLKKKLTPIYYMDKATMTTFIVKFEKADYGLH